MADMRLIVAGAGGRMGRVLVRTIAEVRGVVLAGALEAPGAAAIGHDAAELAGLPRSGIAVGADPAAVMAVADGLLDFTMPAATVALARVAAAHGLVHVIGTTGLTPQDEAVIEAAAGRARIVKSGNMSLGVNLVAALVKRIARTLDEDFDIEILEMHHNRKIDAPSGTALMLGDAAALGRAGRGNREGRGGAGIERPRHAAAARDGARRKGDIGFASLRGGTVVGEHRVIFAGPHERIEIVHKAEDRMIFARGAVTAAMWARSRKPGLYTMADVLGLTDI